MKGILQLTQFDFVKGLLMFVGAALLTYLLQVFNAPGFTFENIEWAEITRFAIVTTLTYLGKNLFSTNDGKFVGVIPTEE